MNRVLEWLRDPLWQFIGASLTLVAVVVSILIHWFQRLNKYLSYEIQSNTPILTVKEELQGKIEILDQGRSVKNIHLIVIRLFNSGRTPIVKDDFERPLRFIFENHSSVLSAEIIHRHPENLDARVSLDANSVEIAPILLNRNDSLTLKLLITDFEQDPKLDTRIMGVREVRRRIAGTQLLQRQIWVGGSVFVVLMTSVILMMSSSQDVRTFLLITAQASMISYGVASMMGHRR